MTQRFILFFIACVFVVSLTACGKRGDLMRPVVNSYRDTLPNASAIWPPMEGVFNG